MTKDQLFVLRGYTQLTQDERKQILEEIQKFEESNIEKKQILYAYWHLESVGLNLNLETKSNGPMATSIPNLCPCCRR